MKETQPPITTADEYAGYQRALVDINAECLEREQDVFQARNDADKLERVRAALFRMYRIRDIPHGLKPDGFWDKQTDEMIFPSALLSAPRVCPTPNGIAFIIGRARLKQNPIQANGTDLLVRKCFYPWERCTTEPPNTLQLERYKCLLRHSLPPGRNRKGQGDFWRKPAHALPPPLKRHGVRRAKAPTVRG